MLAKMLKMKVKANIATTTRKQAKCAKKCKILLKEAKRKQQM